MVVAARELAAGHWPYRRDLFWSHNAMSCGAGWVALQAPVVVGLGYSWNLVALWALSLGVITWGLGAQRGAAFLGLLAVCPGVWLLASNGTDFLTFGMALAATVVLARRLRRGRLILVLLLGLISQFRVPTVLVPALFTRLVGKTAAAWAVALAVGCQVALLFWNADRVRIGRAPPRDPQAHTPGACDFVEPPGRVGGDRAAIGASRRLPYAH